MTLEVHPLEVKKVSKEDLYAALMEKYPGLTPNEIADMNPQQQLVALRGPRIVTVDSLEQLQSLQQRRR